VETSLRSPVARMLLVLVGAVALTVAASAIGRALLVPTQPVDIATDAVEAAADRDEARLLELTRAPAAEQLLDLVGPGDEVAGREVRHGSDGEPTVSIDVRRGPGDVVRVALRLQAVDDGWVVVDASLR
jgi:hypothetical protein